MKKQLYIAISVLSLSVLLMAGCTGVKTATRGVGNEAFLEFVAQVPSFYSGGVDVTVDGNVKFRAEVKRDHAKRPKGLVYAISTGTHDVTVSYNNRIIYQQKIFVSAQETKRIVLP